ncbi:MAG: chemotaxis protein CheW [Myxacorys californica WJT36-NPBG1]|jgi:purine-binding chemotaxis protein CheW|nr:chemotaxis protein CheW [Myxacorys californica WJT36-NPBG1]
MAQQFCTFYLNNTHFGIPIHQVQEIVRHQTPTRIPLAESNVCGLINLRGQIIAVINLKRRLGIHTEIIEQRSDSVQYNVVICVSDEVVSLQVDQLDDILELGDDDFEPSPATLQGTLRQFLQGAYKMANGFLLVLDPAKVLETKP